MQSCPKCWSAVDIARETACSQCGEPLVGDRRRGAARAARGPRQHRSVWVVPVLAIGAITFWLGLRFGSAGALQESGTARAEQSDDPAQDDRSNANSEPSVSRDEGAGDTVADAATPIDERAVHWRLRADDDRAVDALLATDVARPDGVTMWLPLRDLPLDGALRDAADADLSLWVVHVDPVRGFVILHVRGESSLPADTERARLTASTQLDTSSELRAQNPAGVDLGRVRALGRTVGGEQLQLDRDLPDGAVLFAVDGAAVGYVVDRRTALTFDAALPWLERASSMRELTDVQRELGDMDPNWLLREAGRLLGDDDASVQSMRRAIELCARAAALARDRDTIELANERQVIGWHNLIRLQSRSDRVAAIASARAALAMFADQHAIHTDLVRLLAANDDVLEAFDAFDALRQRSIDAARPITTEIVAATRRVAAAALRRRAALDAVRVLARAISSLPDRADLRIAYAEALRSAGNAPEALAQARHAAALDPSFAARVEEFDAGQGAGNEVVIGFDPATHAIDADVSIAGTPLRFIVDTGASMTTIPSSVARSLGLLSDENRKVTVNTASGQVVGQIVQIPWIQIGTIRLARVRAVVIDLPNDLAGRGLLGMNVLRTMEFEMDAERGRLRLRKK